MGIITIKEKYLPILNMDDKDKKGEVDIEEVMRIRVQLKGRATNHLEDACNEMITRAKNKGFETRGPVRIPTKILRVTTRKSTSELLLSCAHLQWSRTLPPSRLTPQLTSISSFPEDERRIPVDLGATDNIANISKAWLRRAPRPL